MCAVSQLGGTRISVWRAPTLSQAAKAAYQDFFGLWQDADPDIPILKEARAEFDKLK
jgi:hypothetical protein